MTNNQLTRERLEKIKSWRETYGAGSNVMLPAEEAEELACLALAAMDSEPVAWTWHHLKQWHVTNDEERARDLAWDGVKVEPLYRHAQPAPVVPPMQHWEELCRQYPDMSIRDAIIRAAWWNHCRAAMLQAGNSPVIPDGLIAAVNRLLDSDGSRGCYSAIQCGDAHDEIERLLAAAPHDTPALNSVQSVVTVPGKWIPVIERMPEDEQEVLTINKMGHRFVSFFDKHSGLFFDGLDAPAACCIEHALVTHWMPLPAAPQEVKGE